MLKKIAVAVALACLLAPHTARAGSPYETNDSEESIWLGSGLGLFLGGAIWASHIEGLSLAQLEALDVNDINSLDRRTMERYHEDHAGDAMAVASYLLPFTLFARSDVRDDAGTIALMWAEANLVTQGVVAMTKSAAKRTRPYAYDPDAPEELTMKSNARFSFFSGHTASSATNTFFLATVFSDYSSDHKAEVAVWSGAVVYSLLTGYFRVDSGHHFTTDTITGLIVGAAAGYLVPALHRRDNDHVSVTPQSAAGTVGITATFSF